MLVSVLCVIVLPSLLPYVPSSITARDIGMFPSNIPTGRSYLNIPCLGNGVLAFVKTFAASLFKVSVRDIYNIYIYVYRREKIEKERTKENTEGAVRDC